jgi:hypothetical protein
VLSNRLRRNLTAVLGFLQRGGRIAEDTVRARLRALLDAGVLLRRVPRTMIGGRSEGRGRCGICSDLLRDHGEARGATPNLSGEVDESFRGATPPQGESPSLFGSEPRRHRVGASTFHALPGCPRDKVDDLTFDLCRPTLAAQGERTAHGRDQGIGVDRFLQNIEGPRFHGTNTGPHVACPSDEDDGDPRLPVGELGLQREAAAAVLPEAKIEHQAGWLIWKGLLEEGLGRCELTGVEIGRGKGAAHSPAYGVIFIHDVHYAIGHRHPWAPDWTTERIYRVTVRWGNTSDEFEAGVPRGICPHPRYNQRIRTRYRSTL